MDHQRITFRDVPALIILILLLALVIFDYGLGLYVFFNSELYEAPK